MDVLVNILGPYGTALTENPGDRGIMYERRIMTPTMSVINVILFMSVFSR